MGLCYLHGNKTEMTAEKKVGLCTWKQEGNGSRKKWGYLHGNRKGMAAEKSRVIYKEIGME